MSWPLIVSWCVLYFACDTSAINRQIGWMQFYICKSIRVHFVASLTLQPIWFYIVFVILIYQYFSLECPAKMLFKCVRQTQKQNEYGCHHSCCRSMQQSWRNLSQHLETLISLVSTYLLLCGCLRLCVNSAERNILSPLSFFTLHTQVCACMSVCIMWVMAERAVALTSMRSSSSVLSASEPL